ncbi:MAG: A24 family peptidase [Butyrivibrio sp.]|nr:A24 family peptidase [Butyrivibrio sp.]
MIHGIVAAMLAVETVSDLRTKTVSAVRLAVFMTGALAANIVLYYQPIWSMLGGMAVGAVLFLYALATKEGIGYGDCLVFVCAGAYIGLHENIRLLFFSLLAAMAVGGIRAAVHKGNMKSRVPFVPCILGVYAVMTVVGTIS